MDYFGYKKLEAFNPKYPNPETVVKHMLEKHNGELISVLDQWWPIYTALPGRPPWAEAWGPAVFHHPQAVSDAAKRDLGRLAQEDSIPNGTPTPSPRLSIPAAPSPRFRNWSIS